MEAWSDDDFSQDTILVTPQKKNRAQSNSQSSKSDREIPTISSKEWESPSDVTKEAVTLSKEKDANQKNQETFNSLMEEEISIQSHQVSLNQEISCPLCKQNLLKFTLQERETHVNECLDSCFTPPTSPTQSHTNSNCQEVGASLTRVELTPNNESLKVEKSNITPKHEQVTLWKQLLDGNSRKSTNGESTGKRISNADAKAQDKKPRVENEGGKASKTRSCPFYKKLPDTSFTMDAFCYGKIENCTGYFLSHYHSDHYRGITKGFNHGPIYCSSVTGNLLRLHIGVPDNMIVRLPFNQEVDVQGVKVILLDANHCPGSAVFLFKLMNGKTYLHTGDFRASKELALNPFLKASPQGAHSFNRSFIDILYLDTTYCKEQYKFPPQLDVVRHVSNLMRERFQRNPKVLIAVGTYLIGKERIVLGIAKAIEKKIYGDQRKRNTLSQLEWSELQGLLTSEPASTNVHIVPMRTLNPGTLSNYLKDHSTHFNAIIGIRPTGWAFKGSGLNDIKPRTHGNISIYDVPYSEHSSYLELQEFVQIVRPRKIIPTVNVHSEKSRSEMNRIFHNWTIENPNFNKSSH